MAARVQKSASDRVAWRERILLRAASGRSNVTEACRAAGISRTVFYRWKARAGAEGPSGLADRSRRPHGHPRTTPTETVAKIVLLRSRYGWGPARIAAFLESEQGIKISGPGIWKILDRLDMGRGGRRGRPRAGVPPEAGFHDLDISAIEVRPPDAAAGERPLFLYFAADVAADVTVARAYDRCEARVAVAFLSYALSWLPFRPHAVRTEAADEFGGPFRDFLHSHGIRAVAGRPVGALPLDVAAVGIDRLRRGMLLSGNAGILDKILAWEIRAHLKGRADTAGPRNR